MTYSELINILNDCRGLCMARKRIEHNEEATLENKAAIRVFESMMDVIRKHMFDKHLHGPDNV